MLQIVTVVVVIRHHVHIVIKHFLVVICFAIVIVMFANIVVVRKIFLTIIIFFLLTLKKVQSNEFEENFLFSIKNFQEYKTQETVASVEKACMEFLIFFLKQNNIEVPVESYEDFLNKAESVKTRSTVVGGMLPEGENKWNFIKYGKPVNINFIGIGNATQFILRESYLDDGSFEACSFSYTEDPSEDKGSSVYYFNISSFQYKYELKYLRRPFNDSQGYSRVHHLFYLVPRGTRAERINDRFSLRDRTANMLNQYEGATLLITKILILILFSSIVITIFNLIKTYEIPLRKRKIILLVILSLLFIILLYIYNYIDTGTYMYR